MTPVEERRPAEVFPPGEFLREELEARGWTQTELADILGRPIALVNEIVAGKRGISPETARGLADAFGTSAEYWLNLESAYQLSRTQAHNGAVSKRARLYSVAPIREMVRRNWIEWSENVDVLERRLLDFFEVADLDDEPAFIPHAARKSTSYQDLTPAQRAWLFRSRHLAHAVSVTSVFSKERFKEAIRRLQALRHSPDEIRHVPRILADAGVRFLMVEPLPQTRIDGACFWLDEKSPVVVVSLRFDRIDYFWHTLMHELGHVKNKDGIDGVSLDTDLVGDNGQLSIAQTEVEREADRFAAEALIPQDALEDFVIRIRPLYSKARIIGFAALIGVHPGIVVGQLQHRGEISCLTNREMLAKVRHIITLSGLTDGWGQVLPAGL